MMRSMRRLSTFAAAAVVLSGLGAAAAAQARPSPADSRRPAAPTSVTAFVDVSVVPMDSERVLPHQTVVVRGGHVVRLGPVGRVAVPAAARRIDGRGKFLMPGLADMHTHLAYANRTTPEARVSDSARMADAERQLFVMLANGITTIRNMDFRLPDERHMPLNGYPVIRGPELLELKARAARGAILSPRIYTSANWRLDSTKSIDENMRLYKAAGYDHLKIYPDFENDTTLDSLGRAARRYGVPLAGHRLNGPDSILRSIAFGHRSIEHGVFSLETPQTVLDSAVRAGVWNSPTIGLLGYLGGHTRATPLQVKYGAAEYAMMHGTFRVDSGIGRQMADTIGRAVDTSDARQTDEDRRNYARQLAAGLGLLLGTDAYIAFGAPGFMIHDALQEFVRVGLTPYQALMTGTVNVAKYFGTEDSTGTVAVGKRADLVLVTGNPLDDIRHAGDIAGVMIGGRWVSRSEIERRLTAYYRDEVMPFSARAFVDVTVIPMDRERVLPHQTIVVRDGRIVALGPVGRVRVPHDASRVDGRGKFLMPGLIDLHTHLAYSTVNPPPSADPVFGRRDNVERLLLEWLATGVTTVRNVDFRFAPERVGTTELASDSWLAFIREAAANGSIWSPRVSTSGRWQPDATPGLSTVPTADAFAAYRLKYNHLVLSDEPPADADSLADLAQAAHFPVVRHAPLAPGRALPIDGRDVPSVEHLAPPVGFASKQAPATDAGDSAGSPVRQGLRALVKSGLTPYQALRAGTVEAARAMGIADSAGTVAVGHWADLVLLDGNPLADIRHADAVAGVMVGGQWLAGARMQRRLQLAYGRR